MLGASTAYRWAWADTPPASASDGSDTTDAATVLELAPNGEANINSSSDLNINSSSEQWANAPFGFVRREQLNGLDRRVQSASGASVTAAPITVAPSCRGVWLTPIPAITSGNTQKDAQNNRPTRSGDISQNTTYASADYAYYQPNAGSLLSGQVRITQPNRLLEADRISIDATQTIAEASGQVRLSEAGLLTQSDTLRYNLKTQQGEFGATQYISESLQAHGRADSIRRDGDGITRLSNAEYSTCEPDRRVWNLKAKALELNSETGRGTARNTILYVHDVPILNVPWFNFPIDDRRASGFLIPRGGYTNDGGLDLSLPYYFNLAPNYDLTLTPRLLSRRDLMLEAEGRFLGEKTGQGIISAGYLPNDPLYNDNDRKRASLNHQWQLQPTLKSVLNLNYVSDKDYFTDLGTDPLVSNLLNQERSLSLFYRKGADKKGIDGLTGLFRVQDFQTVDPTTKDRDRPYARLPQLLLNFERGSPVGWQYQLQHDSAYFKKQIDDGSALETSGIRLYHQAATRYTLQNAWGYVTPEVSIRNIATQYDRDSQNSQAIRSKNDARSSVTVPQFTLASGVVFERDGRYLQTLEPRFFYAYAPYQKQDQLPNFDSASASASYSQLFSPYRFLGHDRLDDNNFASLGLTHRLYDPRGAELLSISAGQSVYFADRRVRLSPNNSINTQDTSGPALEMAAQLTQNLHIDAASLWLPNGRQAHNSAQIQYHNPQGQLYQAGYFYRRELPNQNQKALRQVTASIVQPLYNQWRAFGFVQYDLQDNSTRDGLLGLEYDGCCWRMAVYGRSYYNDLDDSNVAKPRRLIMAELTLKGLAGLSGNLSSLLRQKIFGYSQVETSWNSR